MSGRTPRVTANEILERTTGLFFEGDVVRSWISQLARRMRSAADSAGNNPLFKEEWTEELNEFQSALEALTRAEEVLELFQVAVAKREGRFVPETGAYSQLNAEA
jgi:hypothetical protein